MHSTKHCKALRQIRISQSNRQARRVMKISSILLAACLQAAVANTTRMVSLSVQDASLREIFDEIHQQTGVEFLYNSQMLDQANPVSLQVTDMSLKEALELAFKDQPLATFSKKISSS